MMLGGVLNAARLGARMARDEAKAAINRAVTNAAFAVGVGILALLTFAFALAAFTVWLSHKIGTVPALGFIALGFLVLAIVVYIVWKVSMREKKPGRRPPAAAYASASDEGATQAGQEPPPGSAIGSLGVVALVGFILARQLFRR